MIVTDGRNVVDASGSRDWNRPVEVQAAVKKGPRQGDGIAAHRRDDVGTRGQSLRHREVSTRHHHASKKHETDNCSHHAPAIPPSHHSNYQSALGPNSPEGCLPKSPSGCRYEVTKLSGA